MKIFSHQNSNRTFRRFQNQRYSGEAGNVLIYVVVLMLIFGALGVAMVSLFTSSTASTVTRNDTRRAIYMAESGMRYAFSELRNNDFDQDVIDTLNTTTYTLNSPGSFTINVFGPWFESPSDQFISDTTVTLSVPRGELPDNYALPDDVWLINWEYTGPDTDDTYMRSFFANYTKIDATTFSLDSTGDFNIAEGDKVCLAVKPAFTQNNLSAGDDIVVDSIAKDYFPHSGGAININRVDYSYERLVEEGGQVKLKNISASRFQNTLPAFPLDLAKPSDDPYTGEFIVLSPRNHTVIPTGTSDAVSHGGDLEYSLNIYRRRPGGDEPDITPDEFTDEIPPRSPYITVDTDADTLNIGSGRTPAVGAEFDSAFYGGDQAIGGEQDYCQQGACLFELGIRVFFLLDFESQGDGITFTLTSFGDPLLPHNSSTSVGGDIQLSELMGYAGDSRLVPNPNPLNDLDFLATSDNDRGLDPPKIAVEFDTRTDNMAGDPPPDYCADAINANSDTRNDPLAGDQDAVQYVFWATRNFLNIPCRGFPPPPPLSDINNPLYDDNRHDALGDDAIEEWRVGTGAEISIWRPAIGPDGTIYMSALDSTLYALNQDGSTKWTFDLGTPPGGNNTYMPGIDLTGGPHDGTVYSDISGNSIVAINPDGTEKWRLNINADIDSTPIVASDGTIFFGSDEPPNAIFAINPGGIGSVKWQYNTGDNVDTVPALSPDESEVYAVSEDNNLYAVLTADGSFRWRFPIPTEPSEITSSPVVHPTTGTIYVGTDPDAFGDSYVYALNPAARFADPNPVGLGTFPQPGEWRFGPVGEVESSAAIDPNDGTIYIGSDDRFVYAIRPNGTERWRFPTGGAVESSPVVDVDGTVYIGSGDGNFYALKPAARDADPTGAGGLDSTAGEWVFPTGGDIPSSPAIGQNGFIHIGSNDSNFYTISQYADPRNILDKLLTPADLGPGLDIDDPNDWLNGDAFDQKPWAVRLEVNRSILPDVNGDFNYQLSLWMRQCQTLGCSDINGTYFSDTRLNYEGAPATTNLPMTQQFRLSAAEQLEFERFFFGFTGSTAAMQSQDALVSQFNLSFIRPGDPEIDVAAGDDPDWGP